MKKEFKLIYHVLGKNTVTRHNMLPNKTPNNMNGLQSFEMLAKWVPCISFPQSLVAIASTVGYARQSDS